MFPRNIFIFILGVAEYKKHELLLCNVKFLSLCGGEPQISDNIVPYVWKSKGVFHLFISIERKRNKKSFLPPEIADFSSF